jgi:hypothetical protein
MDSDKYNRTEKKYNFSNDDVKKEIQKLLNKHGKINEVEYSKLISKYGDEKMLQTLVNSSIDNYANIRKKAKKFATMIKDKYNNSETPYHILLEKAFKYKAKFDLSDAEFAEFQRIYESELTDSKSREIMIPKTNMMKVLGNVSLDYNGFQGKLADSDAKYLQEILKLHATSRPLQAQVLLQSLQYTDCDLHAMNGKYNPDLHRAGEHVHPIIAALFLPKVDTIEKFFLYSNIAGIVKSRYNGEMLQSRPDFEVFHALTTDPNDIVCDNTSPFLDLLNRSQLQTQIWNSVLHLRNGQYYNTSFRDFISSVDMCKLNKQDTPDLLYGRYDGVIIKRLLSAFSFRPTVVATRPASFSPNVFNPYVLNSRPVVTSIPMINMRVPPQLKSNLLDPITLESAVNHTQDFVINGLMVKKQTDIIFSRGILVFYIDRRATTISYNDQINRLSMNMLPTSIGLGLGGFEKINKTTVLYTNELEIGNNNKYELRSVIISETNINNINDTDANDIVIGSSTLIRQCADMTKNRDESFWYYDPYRPVKFTIDPNSNQHEPLTSPIIPILESSDQWDDANFRKMAQTMGNVFIYANSKNESDSNKQFNL